MVVFLSGVLLTLLVCGFIFPLFPTIKIESSVVEWLVAVGTIGTALVALFGDYFKKKLLPPKIKIMKSEIKPTPQGNSFYWRVPVKNFGGGEAVEVGVDVVAMNPHPNFENIEVPLTWTHKGTSRNIYSNQQVYFNLLEVPSLGSQYKLSSNIADQGAYRNLGKGAYNAKLIIYEKTGKSWEADILMDLKEGPEESIVKINQIR